MIIINIIIISRILPNRDGRARRRALIFLGERENNSRACVRIIRVYSLLAGSFRENYWGKKTHTHTLNKYARGISSRGPGSL